MDVSLAAIDERRLDILVAAGAILNLCGLDGTKQLREPAGLFDRHAENKKMSEPWKTRLVK